MQMFQGRITGIFAIVLSVLLTGCAGTVKNMRESADGSIATTQQKDKSMVVFIRPSGLGFAVQSSVFALKNDQPQLVGIVAAKTKVAYHVDPGKHTFMVLGETAEFMTADLLPNKTYYAYVSPRMGMWKARFVLEPKHKADLENAEFKTDLTDCRWVEVSPESNQWMTENLTSIQSKKAEYYPEWLKKPDAEKDGLRPEDGR